MIDLLVIHLDKSVKQEEVFLIYQRVTPDSRDTTLREQLELDLGTYAGCISEQLPNAMDVASTGCASRNF